MSKVKGKEEGKLRRIRKCVVRMLTKLRDSYMQGMAECSGKFDYGAAMACPTVPVANIPRSYSVSSTKSNNYENEDFRELVRAASTKSLRGKVEADLLSKQRNSPLMAGGGVPNNMPRSCSVGFGPIGRIDEDSPCEFQGDFKVKTDLYPRSRSYATSKRSINAF
ncbi:uncharacterized protein LOC107425023 [Ziziphus jujuba]|uniref:Uncharacterized protein LOC107425023 n=2 Tax=Ziziphus jujuba TaxID=326968 RepID=A0A6P4A7L7_ZIZJJ|nr:uncharacterized protein LOC107425023 [Ziziphus jujuba]KAH7520320.1 hypothetical protein FEM48_Zijuj08G0131600 [Ziziphus jujuba var. spinosa]